MVRRIFNCVSSVILLSLFTSCVNANEDFRPFWDQFRLAIENNDKNKVADLTQFPLETRGPDDSDPVISVSRDEFLAKGYDKTMNQFEDSVAVGGKAIDVNLRQAIVKKTTLSTNDQQSADFAFILSMQFKRTGGIWKLTRIYIEEP